MEEFMKRVLPLAAKKEGAYKSIADPVSKAAKELKYELDVNGISNISGNVIQVDLLERTIKVLPW